MKQPFRWIAIGIVLLWGCEGQGLGTSQQSPEEASPPPLTGTIGRSDVRIKEKWRPLVKINSKKPQKTPVFRISGREWKIHWKNKAPGELILILYDANNPDYSEILVNVSTPDEDVIYLTGKGQYRLEVVGKQPYEVLIEELR